MITYIRRNFDKLRKDGVEIPEFDERWLSMMPHWDSWVIELEKRATEDDERLLQELVSMFDSVEIKEVEQ
jgi:hypothetical protein